MMQINLTRDGSDWDSSRILLDVPFSSDDLICFAVWPDRVVVGPNGLLVTASYSLEPNRTEVFARIAALDPDDDLTPGSICGTSDHTETTLVVDLCDGAQRQLDLAGLDPKLDNFLLARMKMARDYPGRMGGTIAYWSDDGRDWKPLSDIEPFASKTGVRPSVVTDDRMFVSAADGTLWSTTNGTTWTEHDITPRDANLMWWNGELAGRGGDGSTVRLSGYGQLPDLPLPQEAIEDFTYLVADSFGVVGLLGRGVQDAGEEVGYLPASGGEWLRWEIDTDDPRFDDAVEIVGAADGFVVFQLWGDSSTTWMGKPAEE